jgi:hypothetical protein
MAGQGDRPSLAGECGYTLCARALPANNFGITTAILDIFKIIQHPTGRSFRFALSSCGGRGKTAGDSEGFPVDIDQLIRTRMNDAVSHCCTALTL